MEEYPDIKTLARGKTAAIFGAGSSGLAAEKLLRDCGVECEFYFQNAAKSETQRLAEKIFGQSCAERHALAIFSPAFRPDHEWIKLADKHGATAICEPDLSALAWRGKIVAITGTDGKTTSTGFITHALKCAGFDAVAAGNIGTPLSEFAANDSKRGEGKIAVCELSSFQTSRLKFLRPDALLWTNFAPDHLDWHKDLREYFAAKYNLVRNLKSDKLYLGSTVAKYAAEFSDFPIPSSAKILDEENPAPAPAPFDSSIQARNYAMAEAFLLDFGLSKESVAKAAASFNLPRYRFSNPQTVGGVRFYNDSKATNAHSAIAALKELKGEKNLVWLGGGKNKYCELDELIAEVEKNARGAVLIGQTAEILRGRLAKLPLGASIQNDMESAVKKAYEAAKPDGCVLFSPAFSSFGMFSGYAERGKSFDSAVLCLKNLK